jgi:hypothetical protein
MSLALFQYDSLGFVSAVNARAHRIIERAREPVPTIQDPGPDVRVMRMFEREEIEVFYYRATIFDTSRAILRMHRMGGGGDRRAVTKSHMITIAPGWISEHAGLVSLTAEVRYAVRGESPTVSVKWSSYSNATPETVKRVTDDGQAAVERAVEILAQLIGPSIENPGSSKTRKRN